MKKILMQFISDREYHLTLAEGIKSKLNKETKADIIYGFANQDIKITSKGVSIQMTINGTDLKEYSKIFIYNLGKNKINLDMSSLISFYATKFGSQVINSQEVYNYRAGKILEKLLLKLNSLPTPDFYFSSKIPTYKEVSEFLGEKFIAKQSKSNFGKKVFLVENEDQYNNMQFEHNVDKQGLWFFEQFLPHEYSIRGIVTGDKVITAIKVSKETDSFKTNHGEAQFYKNTDVNFEKNCVEAAKLMKLELAGIDTVINDGQMYILEINKSPGITLDDRSTEMEQIAEYLSL